MLRAILIAAALFLTGSAALAQDASLAITTGGTSQVAVAAKPAGQTIFVQNPSAETENVCVDLGQVAACPVANTSGESITLPPGASVTVNTGQSVNVIASDTGHRVVVKVFPSGMPVDAMPASGAGGSSTVGLAAGTTGGCTLAKTLSAATTNATSVKGSAGTLCSLNVLNTNTTGTIYFLKFYDKATAATCNSDAVLQTIPVPATTSGGSGIVVNLGPYGWAFTLGITFCLTGALADNDNTAAVTGLTINYSYK